MKKHGIGILCYPTLGGSARVATELAGALASAGHPVHLLSYETPQGLPSTVQFHRVHVLDYPLFRYPPYDQAMAAAIVELHERHGISFFHAHYALPHALCVLLADQMLGGGKLRLVTTLHGTDITLLGSNPAYRKPLLHGLRASDAVTAVSESLAEDTRDCLGYAGHIEVVPNFVDAQRFAPSTAPRWVDRDPKEPRRIVHISTMRPVKRVLDLCLVLARLARDLPLRLDLIGEGPEVSEFQRLAAELGVSELVHCHGSSAEPERILAGADLYLCTSRTESFGLGLLEAMACAVPVVSTDVGGVAEVLGDPPCGALVPGAQPLAMAFAARALLSDAERWRDASSRARERACRVFRPEFALDLYLQVFARAGLS